MGILDKLFGGGKKETDFRPSADLMPEDRFWELIVVSNQEAGGDPELQVAELEALLRKAPLQELILFQNRYRQLRGEACTWPLWGAAYIINGGCGDDGFCYFRDWLIAQGPEVYQHALADPESLVNVEWEEEGMEAEGMAYVAESVFERRTGVVMPAEFAENYEISGEEWAEDSGDLEKRFPRLWTRRGY